MRINTNVAALNSYNQLKNTNNNLSKSLSRLSSGKRINGAADDAAGLAISEKMNSQTKGLAMAQRNAQDGISMIQTAEGALKETHSILQRMRELSVQSANDTNTSADRAEIQKEVDQLAGELTRIGETTEFNTQSLLDGTLEDIKFQIGANESQNMEISINDMRSQNLGVEGESGVEFDMDATQVDESGDGITAANLATKNGESYDVVELDEAVSVNSVDRNFGLVDGDGNFVAVSADGSSYDILGSETGEGSLSSASIAQNDDSSAVGSVAFTGPEVTSGSVAFTIDATTANTIDATATTTADFSGDTTIEAGTYTVKANADLDGVNSGLGLVNEDGEVAAYSSAGATWTTQEGGGDTLFTTATMAAEETIEVTDPGGIDVSSQEAADTAISTLDKAIAQVSGERSKLGAVQNRLDHTINNLNTAEENLTAAESRISDVDMAKEMMNMSKQQILSQAGTAMMAQANQLPQGVLQLLG